MRTRLRSAVFATAAAVALSAGSPALPAEAASKTTAKAMLAHLPVKEYVRDWYSQAQFGKFGKSKNPKCRDVRAEVLAADALGPMPKTCKTSGLEWLDPFTGGKIRGIPGVIPLVPLDDAWESGAGTWDKATRVSYLNDVAFDGTLVAVAHKSAEARQENDPARWLPKKAALRCTYITQWISVKYRWKLSVDAAEQRALAKAVASCPATKIPVVKRAKITLTPAPTPTPTPTPTPVPTPSTDERKDSCAALKAAGLGPYVRGTDPEYAWYRDDDGDGNACEAQEGITLYPSLDWRTERYTRTATPTIAAFVEAQPDPSGLGFSRGYLQVRVLHDGVEVWRGSNDTYVYSAGGSRELYVPELADGRFIAQVWSAFTDSLDEPVPDRAVPVSFIVDTVAPDAPTVTGSATSATATSYAEDVNWIEFNYADYPHTLPAKTGQPVSWSAPYYSGPPFELRVRAYDRAGNGSAAVLR